MGSLNVAAVTAEVRAILGAQDTNLISDAMILSQENAAYINDICAKHPLPDLDKSTTQTFTTASASSSATDILYIKGITNSSGVPLREVSDDEWVRLGMIVAAAGTTPTHWHWAGTGTSGTVTISVYPTLTSATLLINYQSRPAALTTGATTIDAMYDEPLVYYTASRTAAYLRMYDDSTKLRQYADALVASTHGDKSQGILRGDKRSKPAGRVLSKDGGE